MKNPSVRAMWRNLDAWRHRARAFRRDVSERRTILRRGIYRWRDAFGNQRQEHAAFVVAWRKWVAGMIREARKRERAKDWDWFYWLEQYNILVSATIHEGFQQYDRTILRGGKAIKQQRMASVAANAPKQNAADEKVIRPFREWQQAAGKLVSGKPIKDQVRRYHTVKASRLTDRQKRRLNKLVDSGHIT